MSFRLTLLAISLSYILSKATDSLLLLHKNCLSETLDFLSMAFYTEYCYDADDDDDHTSSTAFSDDDDEASSSIAFSDELSNERLYLVSFRWWKEARESLFSDIEGVSYTVQNCECEYVGDVDLYPELVLELQRVEKSDDDGDHVNEMGVLDREYAIIEEWMFLSALKWNTRSSLAREDDSKDLISLRIRLSLSRPTMLPVVKISMKENDVETFFKAHEILYVMSSKLHIWDFSEQTTQFCADDRNLNNDSNQPNEQMQEREGELRAVQSKIEDLHFSDSVKMIRDTYELGLSGLQNLGNTCFMNSAIQCLVHTPKLNDYFLENFRIDLTSSGMNGMLALAFKDLLRELWAPGELPVTPRIFKSVLSGYAPQFSGYNQHDSQEFLAFLLNGLHEDLNSFKFKPYIEVKDTDGNPDEDVADEELANECWQNHLANNDSIIVDLFQGQFRSTLVCPLCMKKSIKVDPFMYLSIPLPLTPMRTMTLTVLSTAGTALPITVNITAPKNGRLKDVVQAVRTSCSLREDETLLLAEISSNRILRFLDKPLYSDSDSIEVLKDSYQMVAYRLPEVSDESSLVVFMHQRKELSMQRFGIPLVARMSDLSTGSEIHRKFPELLTPFLIPDEPSVVVSNDGNTVVNQENGGNSLVENDFEFYLEGKKSKILGNEPIPRSGSRLINVVVSWPVKMLQLYDTSRLSSILPKTCHIPQESVSIYNCVEAFLKEEPLGLDNMWYCPKCKKHQTASKKLYLWRLPEILIVHLKRFSSDHKDKLETFVDFPVYDLDLSSYAVQKGDQVSRHYKLYAVINHFGDMSSGHYTAFAQHGGDGWFEFNDSYVEPVDVNQIKTFAAYVLFYRRISDV